MGFEISDVRRVLEAFEQSNWSDIHLSTPEFEIRISSGPISQDCTTTPVIEVFRSKSSDNLKESDDVRLLPEKGSNPPQPGEQTRVEVTGGNANLVRIEAPTVGIFWRSPNPGAPPFAEVGQQVDPESTVGIVEVMKLMNHIKAGVAGRIVESVAKNGETVEAGASLFIVQVDDLEDSETSS